MLAECLSKTQNQKESLENQKDVQVQNGLTNYWYHDQRPYRSATQLSLVHIIRLTFQYAAISAVILAVFLSQVKRFMVGSMFWRLRLSRLL